MPLSELLRCANFSVAAGCSPSVVKVHDGTDTVTRDWSDDAGENAASHGAAGLQDNPVVQAVVLRIWDQFSHGPSNVISPDDYKDFVLRLIRVLIPGLPSEHEKSLVNNTWDEDSCGLGHLPLPMFFTAMVRFAKLWRGSEEPALVAAFLQDLFLRITRPVIMNADGTMTEKDPTIVVSFADDESNECNLHNTCDFAGNVVFRVDTGIGKFISAGASVYTGSMSADADANICLVKEYVRDPHEENLPEGSGVAYKWAPLDDITPMGMVTLAALRQLQTSAREHGDMNIEVSETPIADPVALFGLFYQWLFTQKTTASSVLTCTTTSKGKCAARNAPVIIVEETGQPLTMMGLACSGNAPKRSLAMLSLLPAQGSMLYRLDKLRQGLKPILGGDAADAAFPGFAVADAGPKRDVHLPSFPDVLDGVAALDPKTGLVTPVKDENLLMYGSMSLLVEATLEESDLFSKPNGVFAVPKARPTTIPERTRDPGNHVHESFPVAEEGLMNDMQDVITLGNAPPVTLWVYGDCDPEGDYKTETCRRLAKRLGLQWLKPAYLLELAVKTPQAQRTPLMARAAEMLQRGMSVPTADVLSLALESMSSALCKTTGYVLELPPLTKSELEVVENFASQVKQLSCMTNISAQCPLVSFVEIGGVRRPVIRSAGEPLPVAKPDSEPPRVAPEPEEPAPPAEGEEATEATPAAAAPEEELVLTVGSRVEVKAALYANQGPQFEIMEGWKGTVQNVDAEGDALISFESPECTKYVFAQDRVALKNAPPPEEAAPEAEEDATAKDAAEEALQVSVPNPWMDSMPRRLVSLSTESDELAAWTLAKLKSKHAERARKLKELADAGEDPPEEPEEDIPEPEMLPEDEAEQAELFQKYSGDILLTMAPFVPTTSLDPPIKLPAIPDETKTVVQEDQDRVSLKSAQDLTCMHVHEKYDIPVLSLRADARPPEEMAELLATTTGCFRGPSASLPVPLDGGSVGSLNELLRCPTSSLKGDAGAELDELQASRMWSLWRQQCPVALVDARLRPGESEQAEFAKKYKLKNMFSSMSQRQVLRGDQNFAVNYAGRVFLFSGEEEMRKFCTWPKRFLVNAPRINAPGLYQGLTLMGPCRYRCRELADRLASVYGFDVVDTTQLVEEAMQKPTAEIPPEPSEETDAPVAPIDNRLKLFEEEKHALLSGQTLGKATLMRLIAEYLGVDKNMKLISDREATIESQKLELEKAKEAEQEPPAHVVVDEDSGNPVVDYSEPLATPSKGFVLLGFPETAEDLQELKTRIKLQVDRIIILKKGAPPATEIERTIQADKGDAEEVPFSMPAEVLAADGFYSDGTEAALEASAATFATFEGAEELNVVEVPLEKDEHSQFIAIRKLVDPFYTTVEEPTVGLEIPDPDEWVAPEPVEVEEGQEPPEPPEKPAIPWGTFGPYCPVSFKDDFWLYPGQKEFQHVVGNNVYAFASDRARDAFLAEPVQYLTAKEPALPPPKVLITGPTGSGVGDQCKLLSDLYRLPVLKLQDMWLEQVGLKVEARKATNKTQADKAKGEEEPMLEDGAPLWLPNWKPEPPKEDGEEAEAEAPAEEEPVPEDDGFEDPDAREALYIEALRDVFGAHTGGCIIDGSFFGNAEVSPDILKTVHVTPEVWEEMKEKRVLQNLLVKAQRIPDIAIVLKCKHDIAARATYDFAKIDQDFAAKVEQLKQALAAFDAESEDPPPDPVKYGLPEGFNPEEEQEEKESQRVRAQFVTRKLAEEADLKEFVAALKAARAPVLKIESNRGKDVAHKTARWHCRPFTEQRASLLLRSQVAKVTLGRRTDRLGRTLTLPSIFGDASPMAMDLPVLVGRAETFKYGVELRKRLYYPRSAAEQQQLLEEPHKFVSLAAPSPVPLHPAVVVAGPPLAGKTTLAREIAARTGAVYLSVPEIVDRLCGLHAPACALSRKLKGMLLGGAVASDDALVEAVRHRLAAPDVLAKGWVLDDFPLTLIQAQRLADAGVVPHRIFVLKLAEGQIISRCVDLARASSEVGKEGFQNAVQQELGLQKKRGDAYALQAPQIRKYYSMGYNNVMDIDGSLTPWAICDKSMSEVSVALSQRAQYYRRTSLAKAAKIRGLGFTYDRLDASQSAWKRYCPVRLTLDNDLVLCKDRECCVEYKCKIYWTSSQESADQFAEDPASFLTVPLPEETATLVPFPKTKAAPSKLELEGYCAVTLVDEKNMVPGDGFHVVEYKGLYWGINGKENCGKFMRRPNRYTARALLPNKRPPAPMKAGDSSLLASMIECRNGATLEPTDMLAYMQSCVAEGISQALVESGERRPLYPGKAPQESALLFMSRLLRARNPLNTQLNAAAMKTKYEAFNRDCALPTQLRESIRRKTGDKSDWTGTDSRTYAEQCKRFDEIFGGRGVK